MRFMVATASTGYWPDADFSRQHDRIGAVENRGGDVGHFGACRHRACDHRFQHLGGNHDRLAGAAARARHFLLHAGHLFQRHFDAKIAARHHQRVRQFENVGQPRHGLRLLDLGHHRGAPAGDLLGLGDVLGALNERQRDPIDAGIEGGFKIGDILRRQRRQRHDSVGQADALAVRYFAADLDLRHDALRGNLGRDQAQLAVVDEQSIARFDGDKDFRMRQLHARGVAGRRVGVENEVLAFVDLRRAVLEGAEPQFGALQIDQDADRPAMFRFHVADVRYQFAHPLMVGMAHIDAEHVGAGPKQLADNSAIARRRTERRDDFGAPLPSHRALRALPRYGEFMGSYFRSAPDA